MDCLAQIQKVELYIRVQRIVCTPYIQTNQQTMCVHAFAFR